MKQIAIPDSRRAGERPATSPQVGGKSNKDIVDSLGIAEGTAKVHVNHILDKLGVSGRTAASVAAVERGIVSPA